LTGAQVEALYYNILGSVKQQVSIPIAVKLHPFFSSIPHLARVLDRAGADGLVLFNRFYQPDFDIEALTAQRSVMLSTSQELLLPLRWTAILYGQVDASLALSTGVHTPEDVIKAVMAGADVANVCSSLLKYGVEHLTTLVTGVRDWMAAHDRSTLSEIKGILSHQNTPDPAAFVRANYIKLVGVD
jgi:dihydroorotate dehydrogenase (fumarate)